ncbi:MAG TPA: hypothetical protein V6C90_06080 [Coleofasciculaceae cyanobacterium]
MSVVGCLLLQDLRIPPRRPPNLTGRTTILAIALRHLCFVEAFILKKLSQFFQFFESFPLSQLSYRPYDQARSHYGRSTPEVSDG